jgi:16S rRNA (uracil1498-N3)-methyltransferase
MMVAIGLGHVPFPFSNRAERYITLTPDFVMLHCSKSPAFANFTILNPIATVGACAFLSRRFVPPEQDRRMSRCRHLQKRRVLTKPRCMERYDFRTQRLFADTTLTPGATFEPDRAQANYLLNVLRLKEGSQVLLFNGRDGEWLAQIAGAKRKGCSLELLRQTRPQPPDLDLHYLFAPLKQARLDYMVQKAVEMGAGVLQPVLTHHTQVNRLNTERMRANAIEAAEQCGILTIADCREPVKLEALLSQWDTGRQIIFCDESAPDGDPSSLLAPLAGKPLAVLIGPEGGFSQEERERLCALPFVTAIGLGPRILRADTAAVAALAVVQAAIGDWRRI